MMHRQSVTVGSEEIIFETGRIAKQAQGAVLVTAGETMVLSAVSVAPAPSPGLDFFPLTVDYREKAYAAGKIPGNYFRREGRPSEREILVCRLTDRPIRPLFPKGFNYETQVCQLVLSADNIADPGIASINAASAALSISKIPFDGPIGAVRVGRFDGVLVVNPPIDDMPDSTIDIVMAGTKDSIIMVEGGAKEVSDDVMLDALEFGHGFIKQIIECIEKLRGLAGVEKMVFVKPPDNEAVIADVKGIAEEKLRTALAITQKHPRHDAIDAIRTEAHTVLAAKYGAEVYEKQKGDINKAIGKMEKVLMRDMVVRTNRRLDGRDLTTVRPITIELGILPRAHGSALFTRGETQAIVAATLGTARDEQRTDELTGDQYKRFYLAYNFPPWSVGEVRRISGPGRREIGHGRLAERALEAIMPFTENGVEKDFPYTIRVVAEITESNGSSSMASVCGGSLSMMDAGIPTLAPVAGIAMGLIKEGDEVRVLTDILGDEDHLGDMDFKVCGTSEGVTAFQMDCKIAGVSKEVMRQALAQASAGRAHILEKMNEAIDAPRAELSQYAPRITTIKINPDKIREVIGPGGKVIREIQSASGAEIDIEDDGTINVACANAEGMQTAIAMIQAITAEAEVGRVYHGTVTRLMNFGCFVSIVGSKEGLVHISELAPHRVNTVEDEVQVGDEIDVKVIEVDSMGRVNLSKVQADIELGKISGEGYDADRARQGREKRGSGDRPRSGGDRDRGGRGGPPRGGGGGGGGRRDWR